MKVTCSDCGNSWEITDDELPADGSDVEVSCPSCGSSVAAGREDAARDGRPQVQWFVAVGRDKKGPLAEEDVKKMIAAGEIAPGGFVWRQGFENWKKAGEVPEFQAAFGGGQGDDAGMLWQRRETSVLFSLDDYKQRKATRGQNAVKDADVVDVRRIDDDSSASAGQGAGGGLITFDENEVQRVADALARKKKTRRGIAGLSIAVIAIVVVGASGFVAWQLYSNRKLVSAPKASTETISPEELAARREAVEKQQAEQQAAQQQPDVKEAAPEPEKEVATEEPAKEEPAADAERVKKAAAKKTAEPKESASKSGSETKSASTKQAAKAAEKKADPVGAGNDADSLLAQLNAGKAKGSAKKGGSDDASKDSNLPERLAVSQVMKGFSAKKGAMETCVRDSGEAVPFSAKANVEIEGSGRVAGVRLSGGGAARGCLEGVLRSVTFDKFSGPNMKVPYTISIR